VSVADSLRLTIVGPADSRDLELPGDMPLAELIPQLLEVGLASSEDATQATDWVLAAVGGGVLSRGRSLLQSGVVEGQVLHLRRQANRREAPPAVEPRHRVLEAGSPRSRTRAVLPRGPGLSDRLRGSRDYLARLDQMIRAAPLQRCATIAVVSPKGGVGKSTASVLLGSLLSQLRDESVIAVDADSDYGSLGPWLAPDHQYSVSDLVEAVDQPFVAVAALDRRTASGPDRLRLWPAPTDPLLMAELDRGGYAAALAQLQRRADILIVDCGTGLGQPGVQAAVEAATQLVVVTDLDPATVDQVSRAAALLRHTGAPVTVVVNRAKLADSEAIRIDPSFPFASALLALADEPAAARALSTGSFSIATAPGIWQRELRELAAVLVSAWPTLGLCATQAVA
jgi:MinD-like ATPase involved in chromosome partitioning or flagellar assembly